MSPSAAFTRTLYLSLYAKSLPLVVLWAVGINGLMAWPHAIYYVSNKAHRVPKINDLLV